MSEPNYRSWRKKAPQNALSDAATKRWTEMLQQSKSAIDELSGLIEETNYHVNTSKKLVELLEIHEERVLKEANELGNIEDRIFGRLDKIEKRLACVEQMMEAHQSSLNAYEKEQEFASLNFTLSGEDTSPIASFNQMISEAGGHTDAEHQSLDSNTVDQPDETEPMISFRKLMDDHRSSAA